MGLFDVLKYQNTDLTNRIELEALPEELIDVYWQRANSTHPDSYMPTAYRKCRALAVWAQNEDGSENPYARGVFIESLKEYNS